MKIVDLVNLYCFIPLDIKLDILMDIIRPNYIKLNHSHQIWNLAKLGSGPELSPTVMVEEEKEEKRNSVSKVPVGLSLWPKISLAFPKPYTAQLFQIFCSFVQFICKFKTMC